MVPCEWHVPTKLLSLLLCFKSFAFSTARTAHTLMAPCKWHMPTQSLVIVVIYCCELGAGELHTCEAQSSSDAPLVHASWHELFKLSTLERCKCFVGLEAGSNMCKHSLRKAVHPPLVLVSCLDCSPLLQSWGSVSINAQLCCLCVPTHLRCMPP